MQGLANDRLTDSCEIASFIGSEFPVSLGSRIQKCTQQLAKVYISC